MNKSVFVNVTIYNIPQWELENEFWAYTVNEFSTWETGILFVFKITYN